MEIRLKPGKDRSVRGGHPWIFSGALDSPPSGIAPGSVVRIVDATGKYAATGYYNPRCGIAVRVLTLEDIAVDGLFYRQRIAAALALRRTLLPPDTDSFRLLNGEGDFLPGFVADVYDSVIVLQCLTAGAAAAKDDVVTALLAILQPTGIIERSVGSVRREEGLGQDVGVLYGSVDEQPLAIRENGLQFAVDLRSGQKTGFFLDQRDNRQLVRELARDRSVLNAFAYSGAFSVYAASGGASRVVSIESSAPALELARRNWEANGLAPELGELIDADVFRFLRQDERTYDLLVLDPPALAKHRNQAEHATRAYKDLHLWAFKRSNPDALIATFTCSQHMSMELFTRAINSAATDARKRVRIVRRLGAGIDHPVQLAHPEGEYLRGLLLQVG